VKVGDRVRRIRKKLKEEDVGTVCEIKDNRIFVNWSDKKGVRFRWASKQDLEVINESR